jgi:heme exporter protein B
MNRVLGVLQKDLLVAWRGRARQVGLLAYGIALLLLFSFAVGPDTATLREHAAAYLWLAALSASTLLLAQSMQQETETGALEALLLIPVSPAALFYGKALANLIALLALVVTTLPVAFVLFDLSLAGSPFALAAVLCLGCAGIVAPGTLYAALTARIPAQQVILPVLLFPLAVPPLLGAVKATGLILTGDPMHQLAAWLGLLACFDALYWSLCGVLFARVLEE